MVKTYEITLRSAETATLIYIHDIDRWTEAKTPEKVELMAKDLIALWYGIAEEEINLKINVKP